MPLEICVIRYISRWVRVGGDAPARAVGRQKPLQPLNRHTLPSIESLCVYEHNGVPIHMKQTIALKLETNQ